MDSKRKLKLLSVIPIVSTIIIFFLTINKLKKEKASFKKWLIFNLIWFVSGMTMSVIGACLKTFNFPVLQAVIMWFIMVITNFSFISLHIPAGAASNKKQKKSPSIRNKIVLLILIFGIILSILVGFLFMMDESLSYPDNNGASDTSLCTIKIDEILNTVNNFSATWSAESYSGGKTNIKGKLEYADYDNIAFSCKRIDGIATLQATKVMDDIITIVIDSTVSAGNAEIFILIDNKYYCNVDMSSIQTLELNDISGKTIVVRMAAESAEVNVNIKRSIN